MAAFYHVAKARNTWAGRTFIETSVLAQFHEDQLVLACVNYGEPVGHISFASRIDIGNIAVQFVRSVQRWSIVCLNGGDIPLGSVFALSMGDPLEFRGYAWLHRATPANTRGNFTSVDYPGSLNIGDIERLHPGSTATDLLQITPKLPAIDSAPEVPGWSLPFLSDLDVRSGWKARLREHRSHLRSVDHAVGVWYNERESRWAIFNADFRSMMNTAEFFVFLYGPRHHGSGVKHFRTVVTTGNSGSAQLFCLEPCAGGFAFFATQNASFPYASFVDPLGASRRTSVSFCDQPIAVNTATTTRGRGFEELAVVTQSGVPFRRGVGFNVLHLQDTTVPENSP